jgi:4-amino-4-deoxy-L-arabinose transferase-like glycosyltransferase
MIFHQKITYFPLLLACIGACLFFPFLGNVHLFDWDEINFAESAREMLLTGNYRKVQIDFQPFSEKPPLFFWLQTLSMYFFGVNEYAARFPNALFGVFTLLTVYFIGRKHLSENFGVLWAMCYAGAILPHFYFKSGIIDPVFNFFIFNGIYFLSRTLALLKKNKKQDLQDKKNRQVIQFAGLAGLAIGLAVLTKGPVGFLVPFLCYVVYAVGEGFRNIFEWKAVLVFCCCILLVSLAWFGLDILENGLGFLVEFIKYQIDLFTQPVAGHDQPFHYHFVVVFFGCFPISIIALPLLWQWKKAKLSTFSQFMFLLFWVVMILFSLATTKIVHYSSLSYYPLTFFAAYRLYLLTTHKATWVWRDTLLLAVVGFVITAIFTLLPFVGNHTNLLVPYIKDDFAVANLAAKVDWHLYEGLVGLLYGLAILAALYFFRQAKHLVAINILLPATAVFMFVATTVIVPKIERYTQGSIVDFYKTLQGQDVYVQVVGFKSYAHYFYPQIRPNSEEKRRNTTWLINGEVDKPVYLVVKNTAQREISELQSSPNLKQLPTNFNGFLVFYRAKNQ